MSERRKLQDQIKSDKSSQNHGYTEISVEILTDYSETVADFLIDNITGGNGLVLEEEEDKTVIRLYISADKDARAEIARIEKYLDGSDACMTGQTKDAVSSRHIKEIDWVNDYQKKFVPVTVGDVVVRSIWSEDIFPNKIVITIEPRMAFGTGKHETTQLCLAAVRKTIKTDDRVLDFGTGSGILAILAARLGAVEVLGLDTDVSAVENSSENIVINGVADTITIEHGSMEKVTKTDYYDVVISNLIKEGIIELFDDFIRAAKPGGNLILSGILTNQIPDMDSFFRNKGYSDFDVTTLNDWACYEIRSGH